MLKIEAIVRPERVNLVTTALLQVGCRGFNYQNITGQGKQGGTEVFTGRGGAIAKAAVSKTLIVTLIPDEMKDPVIEAIISAAKSPDEGQIGDGKIVISEISDVVRVRTGERGDSAL
jgi:nitrogen regulatory protein PII